VQVPELAEALAAAGITKSAFRTRAGVEETRAADPHWVASSTAPSYLTSEASSARHIQSEVAASWLQQPPGTPRPTLTTLKKITKVWSMPQRFRV
jgi:hypothetical protein